MKQAIIDYFYDEKKGYFIKGIYYKNDEIMYDTRFDASSAYCVFQFDVLPPDDKRVVSSFEYLKNHLVTPIGGYARYEGDKYHQVTASVPGNPWFITTLWLAEWYIEKAKNFSDLEPAIHIFDWVAKYALDTGVLAEQLHPFTGKPLSVAPLTWSHAAFVTAINKYLEKLDELGLCEMCIPPGLKIGGK